MRFGGVEASPDDQCLTIHLSDRVGPSLEVLKSCPLLDD
jgi:hypothetical protein